MIDFKPLYDNEKTTLYFRKDNPNWKMAEIYGIGERTYCKLKNIALKGSDELIEKVSKGEISINKGYQSMKGYEKPTTPDYAKEYIDFMMNEINFIKRRNHWLKKENQHRNGNMIYYLDRREKRLEMLEKMDQVIIEMSKEYNMPIDREGLEEANINMQEEYKKIYAEAQAYAGGGLDSFDKRDKYMEEKGFGMYELNKRTESGEES